MCIYAITRPWGAWCQMLSLCSLKRQGFETSLLFKETVSYGGAMPSISIRFNHNLNQTPPKSSKLQAGKPLEFHLFIYLIFIYLLCIRITNVWPSAARTSGFRDRLTWTRHYFVDRSTSPSQLLTTHTPLSVFIMASKPVSFPATSSPPLSFPFFCIFFYSYWLLFLTAIYY